MTASAMALQLGVFRFLPTTHMETNAKQICPRSLRAVWHFIRIYLHAQATVHMHPMNHVLF